MLDEEERTLESYGVREWMTLRVGTFGSALQSEGTVADGWVGRAGRFDGSVG